MSFASLPSSVLKSPLLGFLSPSPLTSSLKRFSTPFFSMSSRAERSVLARSRSSGLSLFSHRWARRSISSANLLKSLRFSSWFP